MNLDDQIIRLDQLRNRHEHGLITTDEYKASAGDIANAIVGDVSKPKEQSKEQSQMAQQTATTRSEHGKDKK